MDKGWIRQAVEAGEDIMLGIVALLFFILGVAIGYFVYDLI